MKKITTTLLAFAFATSMIIAQDAPKKEVTKETPKKETPKETKKSATKKVTPKKKEIAPITTPTKPTEVKKEASPVKK